MKWIVLSGLLVTSIFSQAAELDVRFQVQKEFNAHQPNHTLAVGLPVRPVIETLRLTRENSAAPLEIEVTYRLSSSAPAVTIKAPLKVSQVARQNSLKAQVKILDIQSERGACSGYDNKSLTFEFRLGFLAESASDFVLVGEHHYAEADCEHGGSGGGETYAYSIDD